MKSYRRIWIYHPDCEPKIISVSKLETYLKKGWSKSPLTFLKYTDLGINEKDKGGLNAVGKTTTKTVDFLNGLLNLERMTYTQLTEFAYDYFKKVFIDKPSKKEVLNEIRLLLQN